MTKHVKAKSLIYSILTASLLLTGCGESGSASGSTSSSSGSNGNIISGNVADGYISGAKVCLDVNQNSLCDASEPSVISTANGAYSLDTSGVADASMYPLFVEIGTDAIDEDNNQPVANAYTLSAPTGTHFISPVSTAIHSYMIENNATITDAKAAIATKFNFPDATTITNDYVKNATAEQIKLHDKAKVAARLKAELMKTIAKVETASADARNRYIDNKVNDSLSTISTQSESTQDTIDNRIANMTSAMKLSSAVSDIALIRKKTEDAKLMEVVGKTVIAELKKSTAIEKDQKYSVTYNGGTDIRRFTINQDSDEICKVNTLPTTSAFNPYSADTYLVDSTITKGSFSVMWMLYTTPASHLDFFVHCEKIVAVEVPVAGNVAIARPGDTLSSMSSYYSTSGYSSQSAFAIDLRRKYGFSNTEPVTTYNNNIHENFFSGKSFSESGDVKHIVISGNSSIFSNSGWSGLAIFMNGTFINNIESTSGELSNIKDIDCGLNTVSGLTSCEIKDTKGNSITSFSTTVPLQSFNSLQMFFGAIENGIIKYNLDSTTY